MYVVVETWTPTAEFLAASGETKNALFDGVREAMKQLADIGVVTLGWGAVDRTVPHGTSHDWFAVWQAPSKELADAFLDGVQQAGWYTYFEQTNLVGELRPFELVAAEHLALGPVA